MSCSIVGQTSSVAVASAVFQSRLDAELRQRIHVPGAEKVQLFRFPMYDPPVLMHLVHTQDYFRDSTFAQLGGIASPGSSVRHAGCVFGKPQDRLYRCNLLDAHILCRPLAGKFSIILGRVPCC